MDSLSFPEWRSPVTSYNGLTIVFSNPSRFDLTARKWLEGYAGIYFTNTCFAGFDLRGCEYRLATCTKELLPLTRVVLLLGQRALDTYCKEREGLIDNDIKLDQQRGSPITSPSHNIIFIASYLPQDAMDMKASYEKDNNSYLDSSEEESGENNSKEISETDSKSTKGNTARSNYRFFLKRDCKKTVALLQGTLRLDIIDTESFNIYPPSEIVVHELLTHKNTDFYFDIETMDYACNMSCFGFSFGLTGTIFVVPFYRYDYSVAYTELPQILYALAIALRDNTCVGHNISGFDLFVLAHCYGIAPGKFNYDTMLASHRLVPEIEKSLGHGISLYTTLPYHKNEGIFSPKTTEDERQLWFYNGKDVAALKFLRAGLDREAKEKFAEASIQQVNSSIRPYIVIELTGIHYDKAELEKLIVDNDIRLNALLRVIIWMISYTVLPSSNKQCTKYFHDTMGMPVVAKSKITGEPSLAEDCLLKLYIKQEHPLIPIFIYYRQLVKETGTLGFIPWKASLSEEETLQPVIQC